MPTTDLLQLEGFLGRATALLPDVTGKKMFGCPALWVGENVFALVWKHGRIGLKLPVAKSYDALLALPGSEPWKAGPMTMPHWVLVPPELTDDLPTLKKWAKQAHAECRVLPPPVKKKVRK